MHATLPVAILYLPATQAVHTPPSRPVKPTLHVQAARAELVIGELELVGHVTQVVAIVAPVAVEYVPAEQSLHNTLPVLVLYLPATQAMHGPDPFGPENPTLHVQAASVELPSGELELAGQAPHVAAAVAPVAVEYVSAAQSVHVALPVAFLYLPAMHNTHTPPSGPVYPMSHTQAPLEELPIGEPYVILHAIQAASALCCVTGLYLPAAQSVQADAPVVGEYFPAGHSWQVFPPVICRYLPTMHGMQLLMDVEPVGIEDVPTGHPIHAVILLPVVEAYFPALHLTQPWFNVDVPVAVV